MVAAGPTSLNVGGNGTTVVLPGISVANLATVTPSSVSVNGRAASVALPGVTVTNVVSIGATTVSVTGSGAKVSLPSVNVAGLSVASTPIGLNLSGQGALIVPPTVTVNTPGQTPLTVLGSEAVNQVSPITQLFAGIGSAGVLAPLEQLLSGLSFAGIAASGPDCATADSGALTAAPVSNIWMWNASTLRSSDHDGFRIQGNGTATAECGSGLSMQALERTNLPGVLLDASSALGLKRGTLHLGFVGGPTETDTQIKASAMLRDAGIAQAGNVRLTSFSAGSFALVITESWYAGSAVGGAWGRAESQNFIVGGASDYNTSTMVVAGFLGTILPLTDTMRFDLRAALAYQRTVGEAHADTLGIVYGDHTVEATNATFSGRLFAVFRQPELTIRPFVQAGVTRYLQYDNRLSIDGVAFSFQEADTSIFIAAGLDLEISSGLQLTLGVRQDHSADFDSIAGRLGFSARLN